MTQNGNHTARRPRGRKPGQAALKVLSLIAASLIGYVLGLRFIGPTWMGHAAPAPTAGTSSPASQTTAPAPAEPAKVVSSSASAGPIAVITERRHHRTSDVTPGMDSLAGDGSASLTPRHRKRHKARAVPAPDSAGDQTVLPQDSANVSGADNQPPGQDPSTANNPTDSSSDTNSTPAGDTTPSGVGTAGNPDDGSTPGPRRGRRNRTHDSGSPSPAEPAAGTGESTPPPAAGDTTAPPPAADPGTAPNTAHGAAGHITDRHWTAAAMMQASSESAISA